MRIAGRKPRNERGVFLLVFVVLLGLVMVSLFALQFVRTLGSDQEQRTAIEAAALAAARDLSRIVVNDPNFGHISLSDYPPTGNATKAGDNFDLPVQSINSLLATNRLDCIIADWWHNPVMQQYADRDYKNVLSAERSLVTALQQAIQPGGYGTDIDGNTVTPYEDAVAAYNQNVIRMAGGKSNLVPGSMRISLGYQTGLGTNIQIPKPDMIAKVTESQEIGRNYRAFVDVPYNNKHYVFAATNNSTTLVDFSRFQPSLPELPYDIPTIVRCDADQIYQQTGQASAPTHTRRATACAQPACLVDSWPHPGILCIDFLDGSVPEIQRPADLLANTQVVASPCDLLQTSTVGDAPPSKPVQTVLYGVQGQHHPIMKDVMAVAVYDWIRRARWRINVDSLTQAMNNSFNTQAKTPQSNQFEVASDGKVIYTTRSATANLSSVISNCQYSALSGLAIESSNNSTYDVIIFDHCYQPGTKLGGIHAGEVMPLTAPVEPAPKTDLLNRITQSSLERRAFPVGPLHGGPRPTYRDSGIAVGIVVVKLPAAKIPPKN